MNGFEKRTEEKKRQILEAAFTLMNSDTKKNVTMEDIAKYSNVGKTTVFKYFGSKENLMHEVFKHFLKQIATSAKQIMDENKTFEETLSAMSQNKIRFFNEINQDFYLYMMEYLTKKDDDGLSVMMQQYTQESFGMLLDLFHRGRKEGKIDLKYSDEFLLIYFQALVEGISSPQVYEKIVPYTEEWTEMLIKGIAPNK
ncbi:TetR/AcrR family transcriptional regulator [Oceanobacillus iheyensis]|uniref:Transcriptional regulator (TetR family) n=1 Tax=Oceanobacillus iheyensis (strain DSM 14371 / CIP 107618 / JCM 11309 / KCTC 3954 / HTE831) TaxID=221109 RepID=Q8ESC2_OCEIH|nr:TetR/AcrR family transcriptional regulator [Oceanobacillus iheyensis]BAC12675.1 transcriptional regulator (TetR family) [Oceanobacillus iheyensis HTE831]